MYDTSFFTIFRAGRNGDGPAADFCQTKPNLTKPNMNF